jgi:hypothetical protein
MGQPSDRNYEYMKNMWGTDKLVTDYGSLQEKRVLREVINDDYVPTKHNFDIQNQLHEQIRNDEDYDDWEYGTEPIYSHKPNK